MALMKNTFQQRKRALDNENSESNDCRKPKIRIGVQVIRDFPPGCGIIQDVHGSNSIRKRDPLKNLGLNKQGKVKFWDPNSSDAKKSTESTIVVSQNQQDRREKIKEAMMIFNEVYQELFLKNKSKPKGQKIAHWRVPVEAAKIVKKRVKRMQIDKIIGPVCGVEVGDKFIFRSQLQMVGLHCQPQSGIDYTKIGEKNLAISIVDSNRYLNERESNDVLLYSGQGGVHYLGNKQGVPEDQKLERGNLALKNSMNEKNFVRVIRKLHEIGKKSDVFVYDGLYIVKKCTKVKGAQGKMVFMFQLNRLPGQPQLHKMLKYPFIF